MTEGVVTHRGREVLMMGDYVAVCWAGHFNLVSIEAKDGQTYKVRKWQRQETTGAREPYAPYIDFVWLHETGGTIYEREDSPIAGGIGMDVACQVVEELTKAIEYIEALK